MIYESVDTINKHLEKGQYFYSDVKKEGVLLYDSGEFQLAEAKILPWEERRDNAREDFDYWFTKGVECVIDAHNILKRDSLSKTAFELHQATESFYNTILLVFTGYKPKLHDIRKLGGIAGNYSEELLKVFPQGIEEQIECFELLVKAYIEARYNKNYKITKEQLVLPR